MKILSTQETSFNAGLGQHIALPLAQKHQYQNVIQHGLGPGPRQHIAIIGAGMAGLSAAHELLRAGYQVSLLEASQRVGGRCYSIRQPFSDGLYGEAGAMRFPPTHRLLRQYVRQFGLKTQQFKNYNPHSLFFLNGKCIDMRQAFFNPYSAANRVLRLWNNTIAPIREYFFSQSAKGINVWPELVEQYNEISLRHFLVTHQWAEADIQLFSTIGLGLGGYASIMQAAFLEMFRLFVMENDQHQYEIIGGCDQLTDALYHYRHDNGAYLPEHTRFGAKVTAIKHANHGVDITYDGICGEQVLQVDYVIVTIPFTLLRFIDFAGQLSREKMQVINELNYFSANKIFLQTKERIWEKPGFDKRVQGLTLTDLPLRSIYFPKIYNQSKRGLIIASYTWEKESDIWQLLSYSEQIKTAVKLVSKLFPELKNLIELGYVFNWHEPKHHCGGAFSLYAPGQLKLMEQSIRQAEGLIHFAGEHTSFEHGWLEGAIESGLREAMRIHQTIKHKHHHQALSSCQQG